MTLVGGINQESKALNSSSVVHNQEAQVDYGSGEGKNLKEQAFCLCFLSQVFCLSFLSTLRWAGLLHHRLSDMILAC